MLWPCAYWSHPADRHIHFPQHTVGQEQQLDTPRSSAHEERYLFMWGIFLECCFEDAGMGSHEWWDSWENSSSWDGGVCQQGLSLLNYGIRGIRGQKETSTSFDHFWLFFEKESRLRIYEDHCAFDRIRTSHYFWLLTEKPQQVRVKHLRSEDTNRCETSQ